MGPSESAMSTLPDGCHGVVGLVDHALSRHLPVDFQLDPGFNNEVKMLYWVDLDEVVRGILNTEKIFIGGDNNGQMREDYTDFDDVRGGFCFGVWNGGGALLLDLSKDFELVIANSYFPKWQNHMETFRSTIAMT
ncbi:uncharacterized protein LOC125858954 [Solanum stenotomum]|uniref:uncharacterized protein LOC125858954 n=1 Tax=Solanum stenotomum TaxID=172797 RepID=UPI0020D1F199|nr:uncharacterized protein LOC125858954 [Solanum stenotomum]